VNVTKLGQAGEPHKPPSLVISTTNNETDTPRPNHNVRIFHLGFSFHFSASSHNKDWAL
jgi:hypothetical protein